MERTNEAGTVPAVGTVLRRQFEAVGLARRWALIALGGLMALLFAGEAYALLVRGAADEMNPLVLLGGPDGGVGAFPLISFVAVFWALGVWHDEPPSRRLYHWSMPVDRGMHDRLRVVAGALWMMAGIAVFLLGTVVMTWVAGRGGQLGLVPGTLWLNYFTGALTPYLFAMVAAVRSEHPLGWILGVFLGLNILPVLIDGVFGLDEWLIEAWGDFLIGPAGPLTAIVVGIIGRGATPEPSTWMPAMLLWLGLGIGAVYAATKVRVPDA